MIFKLFLRLLFTLEEPGIQNVTQINTFNSSLLLCGSLLLCSTDYISHHWLYTCINIFPLRNGLNYVFVSSDVNCKQQHSWQLVLAPTVVTGHYFQRSLHNYIILWCHRLPAQDRSIHHRRANLLEFTVTAAALLFVWFGKFTLQLLQPNMH